MSHLTIVNEDYEVKGAGVYDVSSIDQNNIIKTRYEVKCVDNEKTKVLVGIQIIYDILPEEGEGDYSVKVEVIGKFVVYVTSGKINKEDVYSLGEKTMAYLIDVVSKSYKNQGRVLETPLQFESLSEKACQEILSQIENCYPSKS